MGIDVGMGDGCSFRGKHPADCTARVAEVMVSGVAVAPIAYVSGKKICGMGEKCICMASLVPVLMLGGCVGMGKNLDSAGSRFKGVKQVE